MPEVTQRPDIDQVWSWLEQVPDPEIPVISLVDLGIIRDVYYEEDNTLVVVVTPTYSGCPATQVINDDIEAALRANGVQKLRLERQLSPPWTTDWLSQRGRERLREYGIAPPVEQAQSGSKVLWLSTGAERTVPCPRCDSTQTKLISHFGSTPCKSQYQCESCLEPFDYFKCI